MTSRSGKVAALVRESATGEQRHVHPTHDPHPPSIRWTMDALIEASRAKHIDFEETSALRVIHGSAVTCGRTAIISISSHLGLADKRLTFAHELAHLALKHVQSTQARELWEGQPNPMVFPQDHETEHQADVWAAHLLVQREVYERNLRAAQVDVLNKEQRVDSAHASLTQTATDLEVPIETIQLWLDTPQPQFDDPSGWLLAAEGWWQ